MQHVSFIKKRNYIVYRIIPSIKTWERFCLLVLHFNHNSTFFNQKYNFLNHNIISRLKSLISRLWKLCQQASVFKDLIQGSYIETSPWFKNFDTCIALRMQVAYTIRKDCCRVEDKRTGKGHSKDEGIVEGLRSIWNNKQCCLRKYMYEKYVRLIW